MNSTIHIQAIKYRMEYASDAMRLGEYMTDARYSRPRKKGSTKMRRICIGICMEFAEINRQIALVVIKEMRAT